MIKLKVKDLQDFFKNTASIRPNGMPLLSYIKYSNRSLSKTNLAIFCNMIVDCDSDEEVLIDEKTLSTLVSKTNSKEININIVGNKVVLSDGKIHLNHQLEDSSLFPKIYTLPTTTGLPVSKQIIDTIRIARSFISSDESATNFQCVHVLNNCIAAFNFHLFYIKQFKWKFPHTVLMDEHCDIVTQFTSAIFFSSEHHYFYQFGPKLYFAFTKTEYNSPDINQRIEMLNKINEDVFILNKKDLVMFCELANELTPSKQTICSFSEDPQHGSILEINDKDYAKDGKVQIFVDGVLSPFSFNSKIVTTAFKSLPQDKLNCMISNKALVIKDEDSFACFMGVQNI